MEVSQPTRIAGTALFGVDPESLQTLNGADGAVYLCRKAAHEYVIKFLPVKPAQIKVLDEKLSFIHYLAENGAGVAQPIPTVNGCLYECVEGDEQTWAVILTERAEGKHVDANTPEWGPEFLEAWGRALGRMHALATQYPHWKLDVSDEEVETCRDCSMNDWRLERNGFARWSEEPEIVDAWLKLHEMLQALPIERNSFGLIHNDLHSGNFLYENGKITVIDFDVCAYAWFMMDIGIVLHSSLFGCKDHSDEGRMAFARNVLQHFRKGYDSEYQLSGFWWQQINHFLKHREILLYIVFKNSWPPDFSPEALHYRDVIMRNAILTGKPVLPEEFASSL